MNFLPRLLIPVAFVTLSCSAVAVAPPALMAETHVYQGCYLDGQVYIKKLALVAPSCRAESFHMQVRGAAGKMEGHAVVLITSADGRRYIRDEFWGVFPIPKKASSVEAVAPHLWQEHVRRQLRAGMPAPRVPAPKTLEDRVEAVRMAQAMVGGEVFYVGGEPLLFWKPQPGKGAVYCPAYGTQVATVSGYDDRSVVMAVAAHLGYSGEVGPRSIADQ